MGKKKNSCCNQTLPPFEFDCSNTGKVKEIFYFKGLRMRKNGMPVANLQNAKTMKRLVKQGRVLRFLNL